MNKKIVFIVVLTECILAVLLISFFGQAIVNANNNIKMTYRCIITVQPKRIIWSFVVTI